MNYLQRIEIASRERPDVFGSGMLTRLDVKHDSDCPLLEGGGCKCYPDIVATSKQGRFSVGDDGDCKKLESKESTGN